MTLDEFAHAIFDMILDDMILDDVGALLGLTNETWSILGIYMFIHNLCFVGVFFEQYNVSGQVDFPPSLTM